MVSLLFPQTMSRRKYLVFFFFFFNEKILFLTDEPKTKETRSLHIHVFVSVVINWIHFSFDLSQHNINLCGFLPTSPTSYFLRAYAEDATHSRGLVWSICCKLSNWDWLIDVFILCNKLAWLGLQLRPQTSIMMHSKTYKLPSS